MKNKVKLVISFILIFTTLIFNEVFAITLRDSANTLDNGIDEKNVYLTFDDGPSDKITDKVLDILDKNGVKATFFVIGNQIKDHEEVLKRIAREGHSIGLHTYSHEYKKIYKSQDSFIKEMMMVKEEINKVTGVNSNIIRFPGGSPGHLNKEFLDKLHSCNFKIYDWNMVVSDGLNPRTSPSKLIKEATTNKRHLSNIIILMHCDYTNINTCKALPEIINYYKKEGYQFKVITEKTPEFYFAMYNKKKTPSK